MRRLIWAVLVVAGLWSGWWFAGSTLVERSVREALAQAAPEVTAESADVAGFPNRFDLTLTALKVGQPGEVVWQAPVLRIFSLSYKPWHLIANFPPEQAFALPDGSALILGSRQLQASLRVSPSTAVALEQFRVEGHDLSLRGAGPLASLTKGLLATRVDPSRPDTHEIDLSLTGLRPDAALFAVVPGQAVPQTDATVHVDALIGFSASLDRFAGETHPVPVIIEVKEARAVWGDIEVTATGRLTPDDQGFAEGRIDLTFAGAETAIAAAVAAGVLRPEVAQGWTQMAKGMAAGSKVPGRIDLPLTFAKGQMRLGPFPLGPAPRLGRGGPGS